MPNPVSIKIKTIIVDDEPMARDILKRYAEQLTTLDLAAEFGNAIDASIYLQQNAVDLVFLDIQMPQLTGIDFVRSLQNKPKIIFTTAYKEYALEGFELDVVDYLLKPIRFDRFLRAVNKAFPHHTEPRVAVNGSLIPGEAASFIYVRADRKMVRILLKDIIYIESDKDYVKIFTDKGTIITRQTISSVEAMLSENQFARIHRSYIVSLDRIKSFTNEFLEIANKELPIGKLYRNNFLKLQGGETE